MMNKELCDSLTMNATEVSKKPYVAPDVTVYGTVEELTGGGATEDLDGIGGTAL